MSGDTNRSESPRRRLNRELVQMAHCLAEVGPNINEIARQTGQYKETVRYRYHRFFIEKGITVQAAQSYPRLGFKRLIIVAKLAASCEANARSIFGALSELCYLHSFTRVMLTGQYLVHVAVPSELAERCATIYAALQESGLFVEMEILEFEQMRNPPMKPQFFDFVRGTWSFDWSLPLGEGTKLQFSVRPKVEKYDRVDLLILKELDINASITLVKMAENVKVGLNALEFHYRDHVKSRGLIKGYRLVWQGTKYDRDQRRTVSRKDSIELTILMKNGTPKEVTELMLLLNNTPFLWSEAYGSDYCAEVFVPNYYYVGFIEYIDNFANKVGKEKLKVFVMDQSRALRYVIQYNLFDWASRKWLLDEQAVLNALGSLAPVVRGDADRRGGDEVEADRTP